MSSMFVVLGFVSISLTLLTVFSNRRSRRLSAATNLKQSAQVRLKNSQRKQRTLSRR